VEILVHFFIMELSFFQFHLFLLLGRVVVAPHITPMAIHRGEAAEAVRGAFPQALREALA
jgi:hypothetical protein